MAGAIFFVLRFWGGKYPCHRRGADAKAAEADRTITVQGVVFNDTNGNGIQDNNEQGIANVIVSDGLQSRKPTGPDTIRWRGQAEGQSLRFFGHALGISECGAVLSEFVYCANFSGSIFLWRRTRNAKAELFIRADHRPARY